MIECVRICRCAFNQLFICVWSLSLCVCAWGGGGELYVLVPCICASAYTRACACNDAQGCTA